MLLRLPGKGTVQVATLKKASLADGEVPFYGNEAFWRK